MAKYLLSPNAQESLRSIKAYSAKHFGERQTRIYLERIQERMQTAAKNPKNGKKRDPILEGFFSINAGSHVIYYTVKETHIDIVDVLHQKMEPRLHLFEGPE